MEITYELQQRGIYTLNGVQVGYDRTTTPQGISHKIVPIDPSTCIGAGDGQWREATQEELRILQPVMIQARMKEDVIQRLYPG